MFKVYNFFSKMKSPPQEWQTGWLTID